MPVGLFVNSKKATCSIYESGLMIYDTLKRSSKYGLRYFETTRMPNTPKNSEEYIPNGYDFYVINWHFSTNKVPKSVLQKLSGIKIAPVLEVGVTDTFVYTDRSLFDAYLILDPTKQPERNSYIFGRPLELAENIKPQLEKLSFGSFGLHIPGKRFEDIIKVATDLNEDCIVRINIWQGVYVFNMHLSATFDTWRKLAGPKVDLRLTSNYMDKQELISWCSEHSLNVFPYYRDAPGLAATTDQAIASGRALAVTYCSTFRHLFPYISYFPKQSYLELIESTPPGVKQMQIDWHPDKFVEKFEEVLTDKGIL
jgi:hypothetical protein